MNWGSGLGKFNGKPATMLIMDEAHELDNWMVSSMTCHASNILLSQISEWCGERPPKGEEAANWMYWGRVCSAKLTNLLKQGQEQRDGDGSKSSNRMIDGLMACWKIEAAAPSWYIDPMKDATGQTFGMKFAPTDGSRMSWRLFQGIEKLIFSSATASPASIQRYLKDKPLDVIEVESTFPIENRPLISVPSVRMNFRTTDLELRRWMKVMDEIIEGRLDRKGIIHTTSYRRARFILEESEWGVYMWMPESSRSLVDTVKSFKEDDPPAILLSPSVVTGFDFPDDDCRYQILCKVPFPDTRDPHAKKRASIVKGFANEAACVAVAQAYGRAVRSETDWCETFFLDDNWRWFKDRNKDSLPAWLLRASYRVTKVPEAMEVE